MNRPNHPRQAPPKKQNFNLSKASKQMGFGGHLRFDLGTKEFFDQATQNKLNLLTKEIIVHLYTLLRTTAFHTTSNNAIRQVSNKLQDVIKILLAQEYEIHIEYTGVDFMVNERWTQVARQYQEIFKWLGRKFKEIQLGAIWITSLPSEKDLATFAKIFHSIPQEESNPFGYLQTQLWREHSSWLIVEREEEDHSSQIERLDPGIFVRQLYFRGIQVVQQLHTQAKNGKPLKLKLAKRTIQSFVDLYMNIHTRWEAKYLKILTQIKNCLHYRFNHAINMAVLAIGFGRHIGMDRVMLREIGIAALLADIGMSRIPEALHITAKYDVSQKRTLEKHPANAVSIILNTPHLDYSVFRATTIAFSKNLGCKSGGFPGYGQGMQTFMAQVLHIIDRYETLTTATIYNKKAKTAPEAMAELAMAPKHELNISLVKQFIDWMGPIPLGSLVMMKSGEIGYVTDLPIEGVPKDRPMVQVIYPEIEGLVGGLFKADLSMDDGEGGYRWEIERILNAQDPKLRKKFINILLNASPENC